MSTPSIPPGILKRLMALDTPVARRIFELMLFLMLMCGAGYVSEHGPGMAKLAATMILAFSALLSIMMLMSLMFTIFGSMGDAWRLSKPTEQPAKRER